MSDSSESPSLVRRAARAQLEREVVLRFSRLAEFETEMSANISEKGMFVRSAAPRPPGSFFRFQLQLAEGTSLLEGLGQVVWMRPEEAGPERPAGMGVRFVYLDLTSRGLIRRLVEECQRTGRQPFDLEQAAGAATAERGGSAVDDGAGEPQTELPWLPPPGGGVGDTLGSGGPAAAPLQGPAEDAAATAELVGAGPPPAPAEPEPTMDHLVEHLIDIPPAPALVAGLVDGAGASGSPSDPGGEGAVEEGEPAAREEAAVEPAREEPEPFADVLKLRKAEERRRRRVLGAGLIGLLAALAVGWFVLRPGVPAQRAAPPVAPVTGSAPGALRPEPDLTPVPEPEPTPGEESGVATPAAPPAGGEASQVAPPPAPSPAAPPPPEPRRAVAAEPEGETAGTVGSIRDIRWEAEAGGLRVEIEAAGFFAPPAVDRLRMTGDGQPRELLRIRGVDRSYPQATLAVGAPELLRIRTGLHGVPGDYELHVVLDLTSPRVRVVGQEIDGHVLRLHLAQQDG